MTDTQKERRGAPRLARNERLVIRPFVQTPDAYITAIYCSTVDISPGGLQVQMDNILTVGHVLDVSIKPECVPRRFRLAGEVRWAREIATDGSYLLGLLLCDLGSTDLKRWRRLFLRDRSPVYYSKTTALYSEMNSL